MEVPYIDKKYIHGQVSLNQISITQQKLSTVFSEPFLVKCKIKRYGVTNLQIKYACHMPDIS